MSGPNKTIWQARNRRMEMISQERFMRLAEAEEAARTAKHTGFIVRLTRYRYGSWKRPSIGYTVTVYKRT